MSAAITKAICLPISLPWSQVREPRKRAANRHEECLAHCYRCVIVVHDALARSCVRREFPWRGGGLVLQCSLGT